MSDQRYPYKVEGRDILFAYCEPIQGRYITAGYRFNDEENVIEATYTVCSTRDRFSKGDGRAEAMRKFREGKFIKLNPHIPDCFTNYEKVMKSMRRYSRDVQKLPSRIVKAVVLEFK